MNTPRENSSQRKPFYRRLIRFFVFSTLGVLVLLFVTTGILYLYKDQIAKDVLLGTNKYQSGEIGFSSISFNPFVQFPSISIQLNNVSYFERIKSSANPNFKVGIDTKCMDRKPIAKFQYLYAALDIIDLIKGNIDVSKVLLTNGAVNIIKYPDSTYNITNAIAPTRKDTAIDAAPLDQGNKDLNFLLDKASLRNIQISYYDSVKFYQSIVMIDNLNASLEYLPDLISTNVDMQMQLVELGITRKIKIKEKTVSLNSSINYDRTNKVLNILPGKLGFEDAIFNFFGNFDFTEKGTIDLKISGSDKNFGFSKLLFTETGIDQIKQGGFYFKGTIKGQLTEGIPNFNFSFGLKDVDIHIPSVNHDIAGINLDGLYTSGVKSDFSSAKLSVKHITAKLPGGHLEGSCEFENFVSPEFELDLHMAADLAGFENIFRLSYLDSLGGNITIDNHIIAHYDSDLKWIVNEDSYADINCNRLTFNFPGVLNVKDISGNFRGGNDTLQLDSVSLLTGNTDLLINGEVHNLMSLIFNNDRRINSDLTIESKIFDLPELFAYDPRVGENFPYQIVDIDLKVNANSSSTKLSNYYSTPEIDFEIQHLDATIQDFLPPVSISKGLFKLHEKEERLLLNFHDFEIEMEGADIKADVEYYSPDSLADYVKTKVSLKNLSPGKIFYDTSTDTIPQILNGFLNGSLICDVTLSTDTNTLDKIFIDHGNLIYETATDTFNINSLTVDAENLIYNTDLNPNPLATLSANCVMKAEKITTGILEISTISYDLDIHKGEYIISPKRVGFFGKEGKGTFVLKPFADIPSYEIQYSVEQFNTEDLVASFLEDTILSGKADFKMDIRMTGDHWDSIVSNINGDINLNGEELILYGLDANKLIEELKRSQNFNLVDLGAVLLAGPIGLLATKGSDYARLLISNPGDETFILALISDWKVVNGRLMTDDVAFSTNTNRIAAQGWVDFTSDSLNLKIAILNPEGCGIMSQDLIGEIKKPDMGDVKIVKSLIAPVTNLVKDAAGANCKPFYKGKVLHPEKQKRN